MNPILIGAKLAFQDYGKPIRVNPGIVAAMRYNKLSLLIVCYWIANVVLAFIIMIKEMKQITIDEFFS